ncbi:MAG: efflux transporter outer membrane subunit [Bacteroidetes bacterium]|nr:efflux transporter outer membrane subunit [Bacteroidota bacterium]
MVPRYSKICILIVLFSAFLTIEGCKVGPKYVRPTMKTDSLFRFAQGADTSSMANIEWISLFKDTVLHRLVQTGLKNNYDIRIAFARIEEARAAFKQSRGQQWPQISAQLAGGWQGQSLPKGGTVEYSTLAATGNISWEIDLWGKLRRSKEAARANLFSQIAYQQAVRITLINEIVTNYFNLLEFDNELRITRENILIRQISLELVRNKMIAGTASGLVVAQAEAELAQAMTKVPMLEMQVGENENYLSTLLGEAPHAISRGNAMLDQINPPDINTPGIPTQLIFRRPDIIQAEQTLVAANANIGVARASMLPTLGVSGSIGAAFNPTNLVYSALGNLVAPIFAGGQLRQGVKKAQAQKEQMLYSYQLTIMNALKEVSNALLSQTKMSEVVLSQQATVNAAQTAFDLSNQLYNAGYASYLDVIQAQQLLFSAQIALSQSQSDELTAVVNLYSSLGGGWK